MAPRVTTGVLAKYALAVGSASRGAVTAPGPLSHAQPRDAEADFDSELAPTDAATADALILV
jgi:dihydroxy-acid dehydratase